MAIIQSRTPLACNTVRQQYFQNPLGVVQVIRWWGSRVLPRQLSSCGGFVPSTIYWSVSFPPHSRFRDSAPHCVSPSQLVGALDQHMAAGHVTSQVTWHTMWNHIVCGSGVVGGRGGSMRLIILTKHFSCCDIFTGKNTKFVEFCWVWHHKGLWNISLVNDHTLPAQLGLGPARWDLLCFIFILFQTWILQ